MNTRELGNTPHVQQNKSSLHTRNGIQWESYLPLTMSVEPSRVQIRRNPISQRTEFHGPIFKELHSKILGRILNRSNIYLHNEKCESWFSV